MNNRIRTISTKQWCEEKNIEIDKEILENKVRGIYGLFINYPDRKKCVYIGKATNIVERLYEHFSSVKWLIMNVLSDEAPEHVIILAEAIQNDYLISAELLEKVEYEYNNYKRDLHHLAYLEYKYIEDYQKKGECLNQCPEGSFNQKEFDKWQEKHIKNKDSQF